MLELHVVLIQRRFKDMWTRMSVFVLLKWTPVSPDYFTRLNNHENFFLLLHLQNKRFIDFSNRRHAFDDMRKPMKEDVIDVHRNRKRLTCHSTLTYYDTGMRKPLKCFSARTVRVFKWAIPAVLDINIKYR